MFCPVPGNAWVHVGIEPVEDVVFVLFVPLVVGSVLLTEKVWAAAHIASTTVACMAY